MLERLSQPSARAPSLTELHKCRVCGNPSLIPCVNLGDQYLSSIFPENLDYRRTLPRYPLSLVLCEKKDNTTCGLLQLAHQLDLSPMYEVYPYTSASNSSMKSVLYDVAQSGSQLNHLRPGDVILDIGCNDGTLLTFFENQPFDLIGIDAAKNLIPILNKKNFSFVQSFFSRRAYESATRKKARLAFSVAMFYHLHDPLTFASEVSECLDEDGVWIVQMAYLPLMLKANMYDNIVHEHNGYYSIETMKWIMEQTGLEVFDVSFNEVYGGSFRMFIKKKQSTKYRKSERYLISLEEESHMGLSDSHTYEKFSARIKENRRTLMQTVSELVQKKKKIWIYGASTKGNTILQFCSINKDLIVAAADTHPFKIGKFMIGSDIPIRDETNMREDKPDYLLVLPYSFAKDFIEREQILVRRGTRFILPLPAVTIIP